MFCDQTLTERCNLMAVDVNVVRPRTRRTLLVVTAIEVPQASGIVRCRRQAGVNQPDAIDFMVLICKEIA